MTRLKASGQKAPHLSPEEMESDRAPSRTVRKQTLDYLKDRYFEEQARFSHLESKCEKLMLFTTVVIAAITALSTQNSGAILRPTSVIEYIITAVFLIGSLSIASSWGHALSALRIKDNSVLPKSRQAAEYLRDSDEESASLYVFDCYVDTLERIGDELDEKSCGLDMSYDELVISAFCLAFVFVAIVMKEILK